MGTAEGLRIGLDTRHEAPRLFLGARCPRAARVRLAHVNTQLSGYLVRLEACHTLQHLGADLVVAVTAPCHAAHEQCGTNQQLNQATVDEG